jgi:hypothetical protein
MKYIRLETNATKFIDGKKTVYRIEYHPTMDSGRVSSIRWNHISNNIERLKWDSYEVFRFDGEYWHWKGEAFSSFKKAYKAARDKA